MLLLTTPVLYRTRFGIKPSGLGGNETTRSICGLQADSLGFGNYICQRVIAVLAGITLATAVNAAEPNAVHSIEFLEAPAAPNFGGKAMAVDCAQRFRTLTDCLPLATVRSGLQICRVTTD